MYFPSIVFLIVYSVHGHSDLAALVKASPYFQGLLPLSVECWDMDGDHTTLPVVFEDIYCEASIAKHRKLLLLVTMILSIYEHSKRQFWMNLPFTLLFNYCFASEDTFSLIMKEYVQAFGWSICNAIFFIFEHWRFQFIPVKKWMKWRTRQQGN